MYENTIKKLSEYMEMSGKTQKQVSKETDLSTAVISQFLKGTYSGNNEEVNRTLEQYLRQVEKRKIKADCVSFYEAMNNTKITNFVCEYAHKYNDITLVCGDAGAGKTTALEHYRDNHVGVVMVTANSCTSSAIAVLKLISQAIGKSMAGRKDILMTELVNYFKDTNRLIIVDEADHLTMAAVQALRNINDAAHAGIVLSGNDKLYNQMVSGAKCSELQQLRSRILVRRRVVNDYTTEEFKQMFPDIDNECIGYLISLAKRESLRTAVKLLRIVNEIAPSVSVKTLASVKKELAEGLC